MATSGALVAVGDRDSTRRLPVEFSASEAIDHAARADGRVECGVVQGMILIFV